MMFDMITEAQENIKGIADETPIIFSKTFSRLTKNRLYLKAENLQRTGSFKIRGAYNKILSLTEKEKKRGVIASSAGNHAQGVALAAKLLKTKATIVMPKSAPLIKVQATKGYHAKVILHGSTFYDAYKKAKEIQKQKNFVFIHPYEDKKIIAGQGTIGLEIVKQLPKTDAIVVPIGGGGLISGIAIAAKHLNKKIKVIGVQAEGCKAMYLAKKHHKYTIVKEVSTIADGIAVKHPGKLNYKIIEKYVDSIVTVNDDEISSTIITLIEKSKLIVEPAGAVSLTALLFNKIKLKNKNIVAVLSGGNIDIKTIDSIIRRGLISAGRISEFKVVLADKPGELKKLLDIIAFFDGNIVSIEHDRLTPTKRVGYIDVDLILETKGKKHINEILKNIKKKGYKLFH